MPARLCRRIAGALVVVAVVAGCGSGEDDVASAGAQQTRVFEADNGEVEIPADPQRVVATGYAVPVLIEVDAPLVGISGWQRGVPMMSDEDRATYEDLEKIAGETAASTDYEAIAELNPDLIMIGVPQPVLTDVDMEYLESIAPVVVLGPTSPDGWRELSHRQADAVGRVAEFEADRAAYEERAEELAAKYEDALAGLKFGHVGAYGETAAGTFQREFSGSWGTNVAEDVGVTYYGEVKEKKGGGRNVSEYPSLEKIPDSLGDADAVTYSVQPDGTPNESVRSVLDSQLWQNLPAVRADNTFAIRYTEAATYESALMTLDAIDQALAPLLTR
ncbi:iron complex transport system substrate-binding protein [Haloactinopolyspora alba]|uniref:Iron complex transport system substrate-binding protein n=1 Tax=Haloactinopolyspora alba TaxID=648780 RepID=A0A2P8EC36_9ACTN|nr:ABC transporter substrate-binding protein [Haloactinopolyspora alba]PSL07031.1 iron complex transport system substrate-binding protein [Haloactinopolyspora alba]